MTSPNVRAGQISEKSTRPGIWAVLHTHISHDLIRFYWIYMYFIVFIKFSPLFKLFFFV